MIFGSVPDFIASIKIATEAQRHREISKKALRASVSLWLHKKLATEAQRTQSVALLRIKTPCYPENSMVYYST